MSNTAKQQTVIYRIRRFHPENDGEPRWEEHNVPYVAGMTVLDGIWALKEGKLPDLSWRSSCRMGICGSCGMRVNGKTRLACNTQISELESDVVTVEPLPNFPIVRDLVPDLQPMFDHHGAMAPFTIRHDVDDNVNPAVELRQTSEEMERYLQFSYCIKCGCCVAACPTCATDPHYVGPMPLAQAQRYNADTRDDGFAQRASALSDENGPWKCHYAGECSRVCPKGVDPAKAIQLLKRELVLDVFGLRRGHELAKRLEKPQGIERRPDIPEAPEPTV